MFVAIVIDVLDSYVASRCVLPSARGRTRAIRGQPHVRYSSIVARLTPVAAVLRPQYEIHTHTAHRPRTVRALIAHRRPQ